MILYNNDDLIQIVKTMDAKLLTLPRSKFRFVDHLDSVVTRFQPKALNSESEWQQETRRRFLRSEWQCLSSV